MDNIMLIDNLSRISTSQRSSPRMVSTEMVAVSCYDWIDLIVNL